MPPELLGPTGLVVGLLIAVAALWRDHTRNVDDIRTQRDTALKGWADQTSATNRVADELIALRRDRRSAGQ